MNSLAKICGICSIALIVNLICYQLDDRQRGGGHTALGVITKKSDVSAINSESAHVVRVDSSETRLSKDDFLQAAQAMMASKADASDPRWERLLNAWASKFPQDAAQFLVDRTADASILGIVAEIWASCDPDATIDFLSKHQDSNWFDRVYLRFLAGFASRDVAAASKAFCNQISSGCDLRYAKGAVEILGKAAQVKGVEALATWASDFPDLPIDVRQANNLGSQTNSHPNDFVIKSTPLKRIVGQTVVVLLMQREPEAARGWIEQNVAQRWGDYQWALAYADHLAETAPAERITWLASLTLRQDLIDTLMKTSDPARKHADPFNLEK